MEQFIKNEGLPFWSLLIFIILFFLLKKFAWKPILSALEQRENTITDALNAAHEAKKEVANLKADNERLLAQARAERDEILKEARQIKDRIISEAKEEAQKEGQKIITQAKQTIESEKRTAIADLKNQVAILSLQIAEKVVKTELSEKQKQEQLISSLLKDVSLKN